MLSLNITIRLIFLLFLKRDSSWSMLRSVTAWWLTLWKLCWFSGFLLITTGGLLFRFLGDDADFLFWRFAVYNWPTRQTSSLLGSSTVKRLNLFDVLIWKSFTGFFRFTTSFCKGEFNLSECLLFGFWKLQGQLLLLLLPGLYVFSANVLISRLGFVLWKFTT